MNKVLLLALVAGALAYNAPAAVACHGNNPVSPGCWSDAHGTSTIGCGFTAVAQKDITGGEDTFTAVAHGYVVGNATDHRYGRRHHVRPGHVHRH